MGERWPESSAPLTRWTLEGSRGMRLLRTVAFLTVLGGLVAGCVGRAEANLALSQRLKPGMSFNEVLALMGKPDHGWGLPMKNSREETWQLYRIPGRKFVAVRCVGDLVADPPTEIWNEDDIVY